MFTNAFLNRVLEADHDSANVTPHFSRYQQDKYIDRTNDTVNRTLHFNSNDHHQSSTHTLNQFPDKNSASFTQLGDQLEGHKETVQTIPLTTQPALTSSRNELVGNQEESNQFLLLKNHVMKIETLATQQINKLKMELNQKEQQIDKLLDIIKILREKQAEQKIMQNLQEKNRNHQPPNISDGCTQTQSDFRDEQINSLKEALLRHIRINKDLTKKFMSPQINNQNKNKSNNLHNSFQKLMSKIEM